MATLLSLSNELLLKIGSFIDHPPHVLQFSRANRRLYILSSALLYSSISFDFNKYRNFSKDDQGSGQANLEDAIERLNSALTAKPALRPLLRRLSIHLLSETGVTDSGLATLLSLAPSLTELYIEVEDYWEGLQSILMRPPLWTIVSERGHTTIKILSMVGDYFGLPSVGSLTSYSALESLDIQHSYFVGDSMETEAPPLNHLLPTGLKELKIRYYAGCELLVPPALGRSSAQVDFRWEVDQVESLLLGLFEENPLFLTRLQKISLCFESDFKSGFSGFSAEDEML